MFFENVYEKRSFRSFTHILYACVQVIMLYTDLRKNPLAYDILVIGSLLFYMNCATISFNF